jgi:hypothetical protein
LQGLIAVDFDLRTGVFDVTAPEGADSGKLGLPKLGRGVESFTHVLLSGRGAGMTSSWVGSSGSKEMQLGAGYRVQVEEDEHFVYLVGLKPGKHRVQVKHSPTAAADGSTDTPMMDHAAPSKWDPNNTDFAYVRPQASQPSVTTFPGTFLTDCLCC